MDFIFKDDPELKNKLNIEYEKYNKNITKHNIKNEDKDIILLDQFINYGDISPNFKFFLLYHTSKGNLKIPVYNIEEWIKIATYEKRSFNGSSDKIKIHRHIINFYINDLKELIGLDLGIILMHYYIDSTTRPQLDYLYNIFYSKILVDLGVIEEVDKYYKFTELGIFTCLVKLYGVDNIESNYSKGKINTLVEQYEENKKIYRFKQIYL